MRYYHSFWQRQSLVQRVRWLRFIVPPLLAFWVVVYQLGFAQSLEAAYGSAIHYGVEIAFYSLAGPLVTWLTLVWVERNLREKNRLAQQVEAAQQEKAAILEEERARIARDLHDGVAQTLYFLALKADMLHQRLAVDETAAAELVTMGQTMRQVIRQIRRTIFALQPLDWQPGGFVLALRHYLAGLAEQMGWQATFIAEDRLNELPPHLEPTIFRLVQESLNNVAKHAGAKKVIVTLDLAENGRSLALCLKDNGRGFDPLSKSGGFGLNQMAARVKAAGGTFHIESRPQQGTVVQATLPMGGARHD